MRELSCWIFKTLFGGLTISKKFENGIGYKLRCNGGEFPNGGGSFGWGWQSDRDSALFLIPHYTTDPAAAMTVLEKCAKQWVGSIRIKALETREFYIVHCNKGNSNVAFHSGEAETLPLAISNFAKRLFGPK